ncbi:DUF418 domain-containing protein [Nonomuraea typhae]|uniref:DUF418 domain-containing protein n=1 Tax=Nonomuraea typhae TaxID=2603600 RepID=UPI0012FAB16C|nr:DUF418 domain-containing protein [Nonomuraea typhae]
MGNERVPVPGRARVAALDVLRGFALCGILLANVRPIAHAGGTAAVEGDGGPAWLGMFVDQRFFPIFSLLFGVGFSLLVESARSRAVLARRLLVLLAVGLAHMFLLWRGDILTIYAVVGLVVLLPSTWLARWAVAGLAVVLVAVPIAVGGGGVSLVPGLLLLGSALTRYGVVGRLEGAVRVPAVLGVVLAAGAVPALWMQVGTPVDAAAFPVWFAVAGLLMAGVYVCLLLVLLAGPLRQALERVFVPLGRMALSNYLSATVVVLVVARVVGGPPEGWGPVAVPVIAGGVVAVQWVVCSLWLRRFRQGPLEWLWRWATWGRRPPLRRGA